MDTGLHGLTLEKRCDERICDPYFYCSTIDRNCEDCANPCSPGHNFDYKVCEASCQDYIHDKIKNYATRDEFISDLNVTIDSLRLQVATSLFFSVLLLVIFIAGGITLWLRHRRRSQRNSNKKMEIATIVNNNANCDKRAPPSEVTAAAPSVITTTTPISSRHPCEDATLEYAYDNEGMAPSPVQRTETTF